MINQEEFRNILVSFGQDPTADELQELMKEIDQDGMLKHVSLISKLLSKSLMQRQRQSNSVKSDLVFVGTPANFFCVCQILLI